MSKKITIPLNNIRWKLHDLFHEYLEDCHEVSKSSHYSRRYGSGYDWAEDDEVMWLMQQGIIFPGMEMDDADTIWPPTSASHERKKRNGKRKALDPYGQYWETLEKMEKRHNKRKHRKGKAAKVIDISVPYSGDEDNPDEVGDYAGYYDLDSSGIEDGKMIYYYPDYSNKSDRLEFETLSGFSDFCADQGYTVPREVGMDIAYRRISHTCLDPKLREDGIMEIVAKESYGDLVYEVCPIGELSQ